MNDQRPTGEQSSGPMRRSQGRIVVARALWYVKPGQAELRTERLPAPLPGEARIDAEYSAISRGTERLVALGEVPKSEWSRMRAPLQSGEFPFPVKYGYSATGIVTAGPKALVGRRVFALHPHQDHFQAPEAGLIAIPEAIPSRRATLSANMETALNAHWDAGTQPGDRVLVIGAGIVGLLVGYIAKHIAGTEVAIVDSDPSKVRYAEALGLKFTEPGDAPRGNSIVFHASATGAGLDAAIEAAAFEASIIELSWYGSRQVTVRLGAAFHSRRLRIVASQVGHVAPSRRAFVKPRERLERALGLLNDPALDVLVENTLRFDDLPGALPGIWASTALPPVICY